MPIRESPVAWRTLRPYFVHELEPGRAPEVKPKPWLAPEQMALARKVMANEIARQAQKRRRGRKWLVGNLKNAEASVGESKGE